MGKFITPTLANALYKDNPRYHVAHPPNARPFIFQDLDRHIVPGNPEAAVSDPISRFFALLRNRLPGGSEQIQENPGASSGGGSLPYTNDFIIARVPAENTLEFINTYDPAYEFGAYRDANDRRRILQGGLGDEFYGIWNYPGGTTDFTEQNLDPNGDPVGGGGGGGGAGGGGGGGEGDPGEGDPGGGGDDGGDTGGTFYCPGGFGPVEGIWACPVEGGGV